MRNPVFPSTSTSNHKTKNGCSYDEKIDFYSIHEDVCLIALRNILFFMLFLYEFVDMLSMSVYTKVIAFVVWL